MTKVKAGVILPPAVAIDHAVGLVFADAACQCTITSGMEGKHMKGSKHYEGKALDFRTRNIPREALKALAKMIRERLGPDFDVVIEKTHLHVEHDPKVARSS